MSELVRSLDELEENLSKRQDNETTKVLYLIRHAESQHKVAKRDADAELERLQRGEVTWPSYWATIVPLVAVPMDSDLSERGIAQAHHLQQYFASQRFVEFEHIQLIVHSELIRAKHTCQIAFEANIDPSEDAAATESTSTTPLSPPAKPTILQHSGIFESNITEHLSTAELAQRTTAFVTWLLQRPENRIAIIGHSAFFRDFVKSRLNDDVSVEAVEKMDHCDVCRVSLTADGALTNFEMIVSGGRALLAS